MKPILLLFSVVLLLCSCSQYQYITISGVNVPKNDRNELVAENDTLQVVYRFSQAGGQVSIRVFNKTTEPLEIEWRKSAVIVNDQTIGYYDPRQTFSGDVQTATWRGWARTVSAGSVNGQIQSAEQVQFIPPQSYIESRPVAIPTSYFQVFQDEKAKKDTHQHIGVPVFFKRLPFEQDSSPARFRSYLTLKIGREGIQKEFAIEHQFYVSEIWKSNSGPEYFADVMDSRGDRFYYLR